MKLIINQSKLDKELFDAISDGDINSTKALIAKGANVNSRHPDYDYHLCPCLYKAVNEGYVEIVELLLNAGADTNLPAYEFIEDMEILFYPIKASINVGTNSSSIIKLLIKYGLNLNSKTTKDAFLLLCQDRSASALNNIECCRALVEAGVDINYIDELEETALFLAATSNNIGITKILIENGAKKNLASCFALDDYEGITQIYKRSDEQVDNEAYILCKAAFFRNTALIEKMIKFGININISYKDYAGRIKTALTSTYNDYTKKMLLNLGADPKTIIETNGANPLCEAVISDDIEPLKLMLSSGANPNEISLDHTKTPVLHLAISHSFPLDKSKRLLFSGADVNTKDSLQRSVMHALFNKKCIGADEYNVEDDEDLLLSSIAEKSEIIDLLLFYKAAPNPRDLLGNTPLHLAAINGYDPMILKKLVVIGNNINEKNSYGETALTLAARNENIKVANYLISQGAMKDLTSIICLEDEDNILKEIKKVRNFDLLDQEYNTLLHYASRRGFLEVIKELLHKGVKINAFNRSHQTPLDVAENNLQTAVYNYLLEKGGKTHREISNNSIWNWCCGYWLPNVNEKIKISYSFAGVKNEICEEYGFTKETTPLSEAQKELVERVMSYISETFNIIFYKSEKDKEADLFAGQINNKEIWSRTGAEIQQVNNWIITKASIVINNYNLTDKKINSCPNYSFINILQSFGRALGLGYPKERWSDSSKSIMYNLFDNLPDNSYKCNFLEDDISMLSSRYSFTKK